MHRQAGSHKSFVPNMAWILAAKDRDMWQALPNTIMKLRAF
jgi:hypothetical protein